MRLRVRSHCLFFVFNLALSSAALATTRYVWTNSPSPGAGFISWDTAAHTIQAAVDAASSNDTILVTNGVYDTGGRAVYVVPNRVAIDRAVMVQSVNGPAVTIIKGLGPSGNSAVRCAYVGNGACLQGFTLTNGYTRSVASGFLPERVLNGGGVWCDTGGIVSNCIVSGNIAALNAGGAYGGKLYNCTLSNNLAGEDGGGTYNCTLYDSILVENVAVDDGGATHGNTSYSLYRCLIADNEILSNVVDGNLTSTSS